MSKNWKIFIMLITVVLITLILIFLISKKKPLSTNLSQVIKGNITSSQKACAFPLKYGNREPCVLVKELQTALNAPFIIDDFMSVEPLMIIEVDGLWGAETQLALELAGFNVKVLDRVSFDNIVKNRQAA